MNTDFALIDKPLTVSEINLLIKTTFEERFFNISVTGEISNFKASGSKHWYFTLQDRESQISAVMFRSMQYGLDFIPKDGDLVTVMGNIDVYAKRGTYQIICRTMKKAGEGALLAEIEKRKAYYEALGWFDPQLKKPIPEIPNTIGVVTASTGAALQDILNTTKNRAPSVNIIVYPVLVQGDMAAAEIAAAIEMANAVPIADVLIVGRGGGSVEDLMPFSEPDVIKAIHESEIPVISGVGHEVDWALSDYVADKRAITPTAAASVATEGIYKRREKLNQIRQLLLSAIREKLFKAEGKVISLSELNALMGKKCSLSLPSLSDLTRLLEHRMENAELRLSYAEDAAEREINLKVNGFERRINAIALELPSYSSEKVLKRGYSIVRDKDNNIITKASELKTGNAVNITLAKGKLSAEVTGVEK